MRHGFCIGSAMYVRSRNTPETSSVQNARFRVFRLHISPGLRRAEQWQKPPKITRNVTQVTSGRHFINPVHAVGRFVVLNKGFAIGRAVRHESAGGGALRERRISNTNHMPRFSSLSDEDLKRYLGLVEQSLRVRRHFDLLLWLQGDVQRFLPHEIMLAGWGDFRLGMIAHDIVSALPGVRTARTTVESVSPLLSSLFARWTELGRAPYVIRAGESGFPAALETPGEGPALDCELGGALKCARSALIHGICDERGRHDCLYVLFARGDVHDERARKVMDLLLPYLDTALRQVPQLRTDPAPDGVAGESGEAGEGGEHGLSDREMEIMAWVKLGKTNQEIGMILDISAFTVKNHLKRIFKKLGVYNRMQAVSRFEAMISHVPT